MFAKISDLDDRLERMETRLDDPDEEVKLASATSSKNKQSKIQKGIDVLEFGTDKKPTVWTERRLHRAKSSLRRIASDRERSR